MKKIILALALGLVLVSCNKEKIETGQATLNIPDFVDVPSQKLTPVETEKISIQNGVLTFESIEFYESIVDFEDYSKVAFTVNYINSLEFNSFGKANPESELFGDEFMDAILNADQIVKIGDWFIRINPETKKVYAATSSVENAYELVARETESNSSVLTFATRDNVLELLPREGMTSNKSLCGDDGVASREDEDWYTTGEGGPTDNSNRCHLKHVKLGIYFNIRTECTSPNAINQYFWITYDKKQYKKTCDDPVYMGLGTVWSPIIGFGGQWTDVLTQGTKNFNKYWVRITLAGRCTYNSATGVIDYDANIDEILEIRVNW